MLGGRRVARAVAAVGPICLAVMASAGCGKKGPPLPPLKTVPAPVEELRVRQTGDRVVLVFDRPGRRTDRTPVGPDARVEIHLSAADPPPRRAGDVAREPAVSWEIGADRWGAYEQGGRLRIGLRLSGIAEGLGLRGGAPALYGRRLSFVVLVVEAKKRRSSSSPIGTLMVCDPPAAPRAGGARITPEGILLEWFPPGGTGVAGGVVGYNVYRRQAGGPLPEDPVDSLPAERSRFLDRGVPPGRPFIYTIRTEKAPGCESRDTAQVAARWVDLFPPGPPQGLAAVAEEGVIRLFWRPGREPDLIGYRVYRAEGADGPFVRLTDTHLTSTTYTDADVEAGVTYSYAVTAIDGADPANESLFSDMAGATLEPSP